MGLTEDCAALAAADKPDTERLHLLFELAWEHQMHESPETATYVGWPGHDDRWSDRSEPAIARRKAEAGAPLIVLDSIDRNQLPNETDRTSYDLFLYETERAVEAARFPAELQPITQMGGTVQSLVQVLDAQPQTTPSDREAIIARIRGIPRVITETIDLLSRGLAAGITPPQITLRDVPAQVRALTADGPANPLLTPLETAPKQTRAEATAALADDVIPAFARLHRFLEEEYLPAARTTIACADLPDGQEWYEHRVRVSTTTSLSPVEIHDIGQREVARIRAEMQAVMESTRWEGDFESFCEFLRTDPRFFCSSADELLAEYRDIAKRVDPELPRMFGVLPRLTYGVKAVPAYAEKSQTTAYYMPGAPEVGRPGWFYANTYDLASRPRWEMEALTLHEAVPGHHLQISRAKELGELPAFRRQWASYTAYVEGWGLYAESLGPEMGFYTDPYSRFGQLTYEMWRAVRLVVDTGIHALGWTRDQAIAFFRQNSSKADHDIVVEIDRYIVWPGQALAYKLGELKLKALRAHCETVMGEDFDIRAFHDVVLGSGALPLDVLDTLVRSWASSPQSRNA